MLFETIDENLYEASNDFDVTMMKVTAFFEAAERESNIMKEKASYAYMTESVGPYECTAMYEEAQDKMSSRFFEAVKKIIEAIKKFFSDIREKVISLYRDSKVSAMISKAKDKIKLNPILKRKETSPVPDYEATMRVYNEEEKYLDQQAAACNTGNFDKDVFDEHETKYQIKLNEAKQKVIRVTTETLTKMIDQATKIMDEVTSRVKEVTSSIESKAKTASSELLTVLKKKANVAKEKASYMVSVVSRYTSELKSMISSAIDKARENANNKVEKQKAKNRTTAPTTVSPTTSKKVVKESTIDVDSYLDYILNDMQ